MMERYRNYFENFGGKILLGCDGFVDEVYEIVDVRRSRSDVSLIDQIGGFGELLAKRGSGGVGVEIVRKRRCSGGFTPNTGRVAGQLGLKPILVGLYGRDQIDPAFDEFREPCELISLGDPALTIVFEFGDGKLLMSELSAVSNLTWDDFVAFFGEEKLSALFAEVDILGLGYWSTTPDFNNFLEGFVSRYEGAKPPRRLFFDFADINKKSTESFFETLELMKRLNDRIPMTLSMNEHEGAELFSRLSLPWEEDPSRTAEGLATTRERVGIDELVIHTPNFAAASSASDGQAFARQDRQKNVVRTAGAGDSFNGGYLSASLGDLTLKERLVVGNAVTAFFVTRANAPTRDELIAQIEQASDRQ